MLDQLKVEELLDKVDSRYGLVLAAAKRARQINEYTATLGLNETLGIPGPQVHTNSQHPLSIAVEELRGDKLKIGFRSEEAEAARTTEEPAPEVMAETEEEAEQMSAQPGDDEHAEETSQSEDEGQGAA